MLTGSRSQHVNSPIPNANLLSLTFFFPSYIFDARNFSKAQNIQKGHVAAVMDVEFSPTGEELVSGSYVGLLGPGDGLH